MSARVSLTCTPVRKELSPPPQANPTATMSAVSTATSAIRTAQRVDRFTYAIRNIVAEARKVEASGRRVRYLNIGDPNQFGFLTPPHLIEAVARAMRDGHNGYTPSPGIPEAREAVAADFTTRGVETSPDRVLITSGTSEGIELALTAIVDEGEEVLVPVADLSPLYRGAREDRRDTSVLSHGSHQPVAAGSGSPPPRHHAKDAGAGRDRSEQPDRRDLSRRHAPRAHRDCGAPRARDSRRRGLRRPGV